jgi:hypothetical protein
MQNQSSQQYAALPERLYVIQEGRIVYKVVTWGWGSRRAMTKKGICNRETWIQIMPAM